MFPMKSLNTIFANMCENFPKVTILKDNLYLDANFVICLL